MQIQASADVEMAGDVLDRLAQARKQLTGHLLNRDSLPLWQIATRHQVGENSQNYGSLRQSLDRNRGFFHENAGALGLRVILLIACQALAYRLHVMLHGKLGQTWSRTVVQILNHWFALGLLPPLMFGYLLGPSAPMSLIGIVILISLIPILVLLPPFLERRFRLMLYFLVGFSAFNCCCHLDSGNPDLQAGVAFSRKR